MDTYLIEVILAVTFVLSSVERRTTTEEEIDAADVSTKKDMDWPFCFQG